MQLSATTAKLTSVEPVEDLLLPDHPTKVLQGWQPPDFKVHQGGSDMVQPLQCRILFQQLQGSCLVLQAQLQKRFPSAGCDDLA